MKLLFAPLFVPLLALAACCQTKIDTRPLPPALSTDQQVQRLNARAAAVQTLKARGSVSITWTDDKGPHSNSTDAVILLHQRPAVHPYDPGVDVLLLGKVAGSEVFEMGVNATDHWLAFLVDPHTAYVGPMNAPPASDSRALRADRILTVLALSQLGQRPDTRLAMTVNGEAGGPHDNELHILRATPAGDIYIERTLIIDRHSGQVSEIRTYHPNGVAESLAKLDYKPGKQMDQPTVQTAIMAAPTSQAFPTHIIITTSTDISRIEFSMDSYDINPTIPPAAFVTPDFAKQGLKVEPAQ